MTFVLYLLGTVIFLFLYRWAVLKFDRWSMKQADKRVIKRLIIEHRGASTITLETFGPNERETLRKLKEKLDETQRTAR